MLSNYIILILLPALAYSSIRIQIKADKNPSLASVTYQGEDVAIISDQERQAFHLTDRALKDASKIFAGRRCTDVYVKRPTPWADVYRKFGWDEVQRTLKPVRAKILSVKSKPVALTSAKYVNRSSFQGKYGSSLTYAVEETIGHTWSIGEELTVGQEINYSVNVGTGNIGGTTSLSYAANWGNETHQERKVTLGTSSNVEVQLPSRHAVLATLMATKGTMEIQVDYEATVSGDVFCNHHGKYKGHMWWAYDVEALQNYGHLPKIVKSTETISIGFYTSFTIEISDLKTNVFVQNVPAGIINVGPMERY